MNIVDNILSKFNIINRVERSVCEVDLVVGHKECIYAIKIIKIPEIKEKKILEFNENKSLLCESCSSFIYPYRIYEWSNNGEYMIISREYYEKDLEIMIHSKSFTQSDICSIICSVCDMLLMLSGYNAVVGNLKSSNIVYEEDDRINICDLFLNTLRKDEDARVYDVCFKSPEELSGLEYNERSVIWSIGCILYEMNCKKLPFNENDNMNKTKENIVRCKYSFKRKSNKKMKEMIRRMLKVMIEERMSMKELRKEMIKVSEMLKDDEDCLMICRERKEILYNSDNMIVIYPIIFPFEYYYESEKREEIRDFFIKSYNKKPNERILSILVMMNLFIKDYLIKARLKFHVNHQCKEGRKCYLDEMMFYIERYGDIIKVDPNYICICEYGIDYIFRILKLIRPTKLNFLLTDPYQKLLGNIIPIQHQSLFGSLFSQLSNLQELDIRLFSLTSDFVESFVKSIPYMNLKYVNIVDNPIGPIGFKLLLPYLHLLIYRNYLYLRRMNLDDESMILLSEELYKYPNLKYIIVENNKNNIHSKGLKALFSKFPISKVRFDIKGRKELLIDRSIPELVKYIKNNTINLRKCEINDDFIKSFISLRSNELRTIYELDLSSNKLTYRSIEILINNLSSFKHLKQLYLDENKIGDEGMKILSPHLHLLSHFHEINCSKMGLSSVGLKYLLDGLKNVNGKIKTLDIRGNKFDSDYLENYMKENDNIDYCLYDKKKNGTISFMHSCHFF